MKTSELKQLEDTLEIKKSKEPCLTMSMDKDVFVLLLLGHMSWNMADGALFILYNRVPNKYDPKLFAFINYLKV